MNHLKLLFSAILLVAFFASMKTSNTELTSYNNSIDQHKKGKWTNLLANNSLQHWHQYLGSEIKGWKVEKGILSTTGKGGDIVTNKEYENFELELEWKIKKGGNSGIFIYVIEKPENKYMYQTGPEFQIIDNDNYPQKLTEEQKTGAMSDVIAPKFTTVKPVENWNKTKIVANKGKIQHWLNNKLILEYQIGSEDLKNQINKSKFKDLPYAQNIKGKIGLQDHGDPVFYKNIRIKELH